MPETDAERAPRGTIALCIASAVLAAAGAALLSTGGTDKRPAATAPAPGNSVPAPKAPAAGSARPGPAPASPAHRSSEPAAPAPAPAPAPEPVPVPVQEAARAFTAAWAGHDARPGGDTSYDDASRRAAAYADGDLAEDLRTRTSGTAGRQQWLAWQAGRVQVAVTVLQVSLPDGAPAATESSGFARVSYKVTETPASGPAAASEHHVTLKLRRSPGGTWRVTGLPNA